MNIRPYKSKHPSIDPSAYVDERATVVGDVVVGAESSVWPNAVVRGDVNYIRVGARTNIQDGSVLHVTHAHSAVPGGHPLVIGDEVTVGHNVTLHGCIIAERCLIGIGAVVLDGARLEPYVLVGAGSLVPPGKILEGGYLWLGSPVRRARPLSAADHDAFAYSARHYVALKNSYQIP